jgi:hypothetical protein
MIISGSVLTTFESSSNFGGNWGSIENWLEPKIEPPSGNLAELRQSFSTCVYCTQLPFQRNYLGLSQPT